MFDIIFQFLSGTFFDKTPSRQFTQWLWFFQFKTWSGACYFIFKLIMCFSIDLISKLNVTGLQAFT